MIDLLSVDTTFFNILGYPMSYIEFFGTLFNIWCVYLVTRKNIWTWPVGIIAVFLFGFLFYQIRLYADLFEQFYYLVTGFWGWYAWSKTRKPHNDKQAEVVVRTNTLRTNLAWLFGIVVFTAIGTWIMSNIHIWIPSLFPEPASLPLLDVFTTVMSFAAQLLLIRKRLENWALWILVDVIGIGLYWHKAVPFVALLYAIFLVLATKGLFGWYNTLKTQEKGHDKGTRGRKILPTT